MCGVKGLPIEVDEVVRIPRSVSSSIMMAIKTARLTGDDLIDLLENEAVFSIIKLILEKSMPGVRGIGGEIYRDGSKIIFAVNGIEYMGDILPAEGRIIVDLEDSIMIVNIRILLEEKSDTREAEKTKDFILTI